jgi:paraquat-inducible protein B
VSARASPRAIGLFVLGAVALAVVGLVLLGAADLFTRGTSYVIHFDESLKGLRRGAPLAFQGVDIGQVTEIKAIYDGPTGEVRVPVTVEVRPGSVALGNGTTGSGAAMNGLIERGLRARLDVQSLLTGQLLVALDFFPPPAGEPPRPLVPGEIPSVPSTLAALQRTVDGTLMEVPEITRALKRVATGLEGFLSDRNRDSLQEALAALARLAESLGDPEGPTQKVLAELPALVTDLRTAAAAATPLLGRVDQLAATGDVRLQALGAEVTRLATSISRAADQAGALIRENRSGLNDFVEDGLPELQGLVEDATRLVNELSSTVRDVRQDPARFFLGDRAGQGVDLR